MSDEWFFLQSMKRNGKEKLLEDVRKRIKEELENERQLKAQLMSLPPGQRNNSVILFAWRTSRSKFWDLISEMRDIESGKSVTKEEP